jgi:hypothetical protein
MHGPTNVRLVLNILRAMYVRKNIFIFEMITHMLTNMNVITSATWRHVSVFNNDLNWIYLPTFVEGNSLLLDVRMRESTNKK